MRMMPKLKYISVILGAVAFVACSDDERSPYLNGKDKTPITVTTNLSTGGTVTRAVDATFESGDVLKAYIRHVVKNTSDQWVDVSTLDENSGVLGINPRIVTFNVSSGASEVDNYTKKNLTSTEGLYWDDFSNSSKDEAYLRTENHALQVFYGYGFNGGTPDPGLTEATGVIGWSVVSDQRKADGGVDGFKTSDLIYAGTQTPVVYNHSTSSAIGADHGVLSIPYSHAMSKVSIVIDLQDGYESDDKNFANTIVTLKDVNTKCTVTAPTQTLTNFNAVGSNGDVIMQPLATSEDKLRKSFTALIAPTVMKDGQTLATITDVNGNSYEINLTHAGLTTPVSQSGKPWSSKLAAADAISVAPVASDTDLSTYGETAGGLTIPGVHYKLYVNIKKQQISVSASIRDWVEVEATGTGKITFTNDITNKTGTIADALQTKGFDIYQKGTASDATYSNVTSYTYSGDPAKWIRDKEIYWPNGTDRFYFRALSPTNSTTSVSSGSEVLWGTTDEYTWGSDNIDKGESVAPRTGDVPLTFEHIMSMITINLKDGMKGLTTDPNAWLDLAGATIQLSNLATTGTIDLQEGGITIGALSETVFSDSYYAANDPTSPTAKTPQVKEYVMIPQEITDDAMIIVTLANGTTYKAQLNSCIVKDSSTTLVDKWERNKHYTYEITLTKESITFRALIKNWDEVTAGGTITPEW